MRNLNYMVAVIGLAAVVLSSCRSSKTVTQEGGASSARTEQIIRKINDSKPISGQAITAKLLLNLEMGGKPMSVGGHLRMKRDQVIQLSATLLFAEIGRIEFTPDYMLVLDRMGKQYVQARYADVPFLQRSGLDFHALQALFWNELFVPGHKNMLTERDFTVTTQDNLLQLVAREATLFMLQFTLQPANETLVNTRIAARQNAAQHLDWQYLHFSNKGIADKMRLSVTGLGKDLSVWLTLSNIRNNADWELTQIPEKKYKRVDPVVLFKKLLRKNE